MRKRNIVLATLIALTALMNAITPFMNAIQPLIEWFLQPPTMDLVDPPDFPVERKFRNGSIEVTLTNKGNEPIYIGRDLLAKETISMKQNPDGKFYNLGHTYEITIETKNKLTVRVTYPKASNRNSKMVELDRQ